MPINHITYPHGGMKIWSEKDSEPFTRMQVFTVKLNKGTVKKFFLCCFLISETLGHQCQHGKTATNETQDRERMVPSAS